MWGQYQILILKILELLTREILKNDEPCGGPFAKSIFGALCKVVSSSFALVTFCGSGFQKKEIQYHDIRSSEGVPPLRFVGRRNFHLIGVVLISMKCKIPEMRPCS